MTRVEAINAWLDERHRARNWMAEEILVYASEVNYYQDGPVISVVGLKPRMIAMPHPVLVTEDSIYQRSFNGERKLSVKIDMGSPKFFRVLLRAMKGNIRRGQIVEH